jgi:predicted transcriptional regulator
MQVSVKKAAELSGVSRTTFYKYLNEGKISKGMDGTIDVAEIARVFGGLHSEGVNVYNEQLKKEQDLHADILPQVVELELEAKEQEIITLRRELADSRERERQHLARESFYQSQLTNLTETSETDRSTEADGSAYGRTSRIGANKTCC